MASMFVDLPDGIPRNQRNFIVPLRGQGTGWTPGAEFVPGTPIFTVSGSEQVRIRRQEISTPTLATLWIDSGPISAALTFTDPLNSITAITQVVGTFPEKMVAKVQRLLMDAVGMTTIQMDGQTVTVQALQDQYDFWLRRVNEERAKAATGKRKRLSTINLAFPSVPRGGQW